MEEERKVLSVSEITRQIKRVLTSSVGAVWVEGEISNYKLYTSGHAYFSLKDEGAQLSAVLFAGNRAGVAGGLVLADGLKVRAFGEISVFESRGQYQLVIRKVEAAGLGELMKKFEELKARLAAEGLFAQERKKPLPFLPRRIGIVTSPSGAVIHDMMNVLGRRYPNLQLRLAPVKVQGEGAAESIAHAIAFFNRTCGAGSAWPADLLIVGRGGGSLEDLWAFNEEVVARAVAASKIPIISAVGHETDFTLCDFAADLRAPTPSAAAELAVPLRSELEGRVERCSRLLQSILVQRLDTLKARLERMRASQVFRQPQSIIEPRAQLVDALSMRLGAAAQQSLSRARQRTEAAKSSLALLRERRVGQTRARIEADAVALRKGVLLRAERLGARLEQARQRLLLLNPLAVLDRGYSVTHTAGGRLVKSVGDVPVGAKLRTRIRDGVIESEAKRSVKNGE